MEAFVMENTTFIVCARIDCQERMDNLDFCISFLQDNFPSPIVIMEEDASSKIESRYQSVQHVFIKSLFPIFQRTRLVNKAVNEIVTTPYFCLLDMDVFVDPDIYKQAVGYLENYSVVYPFDGRFYEIPQKYNKIRGLRMDQIEEGDKSMINTDSVGGAIFFRAFDFIRGGMENELFLGWGHEDAERYTRFKKLGYKIKRMDNPMYHFTHPRGINSSGKNPHVRTNEAERFKIEAMKSTDLVKYIDSSFHWCKMRHVMKISVVIPAYEMNGHGVEFLKFNIGSVLNQSYPFFEIIVSDHSVNDEIETTIQSYTDDRIIYLRNTEDRGSSSANLNHGIMHASGEIIKPLFQDDYMYNIHAFYLLYQAFADGHKWIALGCNHTKDRKTYYNDFIPYYHDNIVYGNNTMSSPSCIAYLRDDEIKWDTRLLWLMDCKFYYDMHKKKGPPHIIKDICVTNFGHPDQLTETLPTEIKRREVELMKREHPL
jgi:GT2 family glycosyltransferase